VSVPDLSDPQLVARCRAGDEAAWRTLVDRFARYVYAIAMQSFRLSEPDAQDIFQEVFSRVYEHLDMLRDDAAVRPWIGQVTRRLCVDRLRATREEPSSELDLHEADDSIARLDEALTVSDALRTLPEHCREILDRFFSRDQSYETIGKELAIAPGTIASRISRCLEKLRDALQGRSAPGADVLSTA
jgi:RNA polymerase sigma-70 factor (ECF subfamily)